MKFKTPRCYFAGLLTYAVCLLLAGLPVYEPTLNTQALEQYAIAALIASVLVELVVLTGIGRFVQDEHAAFLQALLGIGICAGLYTYLSPMTRPEIMLISLLWIGVGLVHLNPWRVMVLLGGYTGIYYWAFAYSLTDNADIQHSDTLFMLMLSLVVGGFMYIRARRYQKAGAHHDEQAARLEVAEARIREFTEQDGETTALKFTYFRNQLVKEKARAEREDSSFSVALIEIDQYDEMLRTIGEHATGEVLRQFSERATKLVLDMDALGLWDKGFKPLGRMTRGRFSLMLPNYDFEDARKCMQRLHSAVDFQYIRTHVGVIGITLSIGFTEYAKGESEDEVMLLAAHALEQAKKHNGNDFVGLPRDNNGDAAGYGLGKLALSTQH